VSVIEFKKPEEAKYAVYSFIEDSGRTVFEEWFAANGISDILWGGIYALWDIYEAGGPLSISTSVIDLENGFYGLLVPRKGDVTACPVFRFGPFDEATEITFLAGAKWDDKLKRVRPFSAVGTAEENLAVLLERPYRRRRE